MMTGPVTNRPQACFEVAGLLRHFALAEFPIFWRSNHFDNRKKIAYLHKKILWLPAIIEKKLFFVLIHK
jgi:hypothetical protein